MENAWDDIQALNHSSPYSNEIQSPFEAMYKYTPKLIGIPKPDFLKNGDTTARRNHKDDKNIDPYGCNQWAAKNFDRNSQTMKERLIDEYWMEKIHDRPNSTPLEPGENIYYRDPTIKGFGRWKPGIIINRKGEEENNGRLIQLKGYDILDTVTGKHTTRTREDIRIKKKSKLEDKIYKEYVEFLNRMHRASNEIHKDEEYKKTLFNEDYKQTPENRNIPPITQTEPTEEATITPEETTTPPEEPQPTPEVETPEQPEQPVERKISREEKNLKSELGNYWRCMDHDPHYDGDLGRRLRTRVTELNTDNEVTMEDYWILENEYDDDFKDWKELYQKINRSHKV